MTKTSEREEHFCINDRRYVTMALNFNIYIYIYIE